jgi:hypothetical protein
MEMWPEDSTYLNVTATAANLVRTSGIPNLRYSVSADIGLVYITTVWNGSLVERTVARPYYQAIMENVDEVLLMDYGQTTQGGLCPSAPLLPSRLGVDGAVPAHCPLAKPLWWTAPWIAYAESLRRISAGRRQVLITMGLPVDANEVGADRHWFSSEEQLEVFLNDTAEWAAHSGFLPGGSVANATGWGSDGGPFHKPAIFLAEGYLNVTETRPCPPSICLPGKQRPARGLWVYQSTADPMIYADQPAVAAAATARFLEWCGVRGVDELYLYPARIRGCTAAQHGLLPAGANTTTEQQLATFVRTAGAAGVSVQLFVAPNKYWVDSLTACVQASLSFIRRESLHL